MKAIKLHLAILLILSSVSIRFLNAQTNLEELKHIVYYLSDDDKAGRKNGSPQSLIISNWIKEYFEVNGLAPFNNDFFQSYSYLNGENDTINERNVVGLLM